MVDCIMLIWLIFWLDVLSDMWYAIYFVIPILLRVGTGLGNLFVNVNADAEYSCQCTVVRVDT